MADRTWGSWTRPRSSRESRGVTTDAGDRILRVPGPACRLGRRLRRRPGRRTTAASSRRSSLVRALPLVVEHGRGAGRTLLGARPAAWWGFFWTFLVLEVLALVQIRPGRGGGSWGADKLARLDKLTLKYNEFLAKHEAAKLAGDPDAASFLKRAENLEKIMNRVAEDGRARGARRGDDPRDRPRPADRDAPGTGLLRQPALR